LVPGDYNGLRVSFECMFYLSTGLASLLGGFNSVVGSLPASVYYFAALFFGYRSGLFHLGLIYLAVAWLSKSGQNLCLRVVYEFVKALTVFLIDELQTGASFLKNGVLPRERHWRRSG